MLPDRVSNPGPLTHESGALPIALRGPATVKLFYKKNTFRRPEIQSTSGLYIQDDTEQSANLHSLIILFVLTIF